MESVLKELFFKGNGLKNDSRKAYNEELELFRLIDKNKEKLKSLLDNQSIVQLEKTNRLL